MCGERGRGGNGGSGGVKVNSGRRGPWYGGERDSRSIGLPAGPGARRARTAVWKRVGDSMEIHCRWSRETEWWILTEKRLRCDYNSDSSSISGDKGELGDNDTGKRGRRSRADSGRFRKGDGAGEQRIGV